MLFVNTAPKTIQTYCTFSVGFTIRPFMTTSVKYVFIKMNSICPYTIKIPDNAVSYFKVPHSVHLYIKVHFWLYQTNAVLINTNNKAASAIYLSTTVPSALLPKHMEDATFIYVLIKTVHLVVYSTLNHNLSSSNGFQDLSASCISPNLIRVSSTSLVVFITV
jgi:hypothetical protein